MLYAGYIIWQAFFGISGLGAALFWLLAQIYGWQKIFALAVFLALTKFAFNHKKTEALTEGAVLVLSMLSLIAYRRFGLAASPFTSENMVALFTVIWIWGIAEVFVKTFLTKGDFRQNADEQGRENLYVSMGRFLLILTGYKLIIQGIPGEAILLALCYLCEKGISAQRNIRHGYGQVLMTLVKMLEAKDGNTRGHSERVAYYAGAIAKEMGLTPSRQAAVIQAGWFHDLGKLVVKDAILTKPGRLDREEWEEIKKHPANSGEFLTSLGMNSEIIEGVKHHHERLDGQGYPDGISELPLISRIVAVADAFDAMTSDRPYRSPMPFGEALDELKKNAGKQHDSRVVDAFARFLSKTANISPKSELGRVTPRVSWEPSKKTT